MAVYVFGAVYVLHAGLNDQSLLMQLNEAIRNKKTEDGDAFSEVNHKHDNPVASHNYAHVHKSVIFVTTRSAKSTHQQVIL